MTAHAHRWIKRDGYPLACGDCGELWPGHELPAPFSPRNEGLGDMASALAWTAGLDAIRQIPEAGSW